MANIQSNKSKLSNFPGLNQSRAMPNKSLKSDYVKPSPTNIGDFKDALNNLDDIQNKGDGTDLAYRKVAREYETQFYGILWNIPFDTVEVDELFGGGKEEEMWRSRLVEAYVEDAYANHTSNIQEAIYEKLKLEGVNYDIPREHKREEATK